MSTTWDDDRVVEALRSTLSTHERLADPDRAVELASGMQRRSRVPALVAALVVLVLAAGTAAVTAGVHRTAAPPATPTYSVTPVASGTNRAKAVAEAARVLRSVPPPPGAAASAPVRSGLLTQNSSPGLDPTLTRREGWIVNEPASQVERWYDHQPGGRRASMERGWQRQSGTGVLTWDVPTGSSSFSDPQVTVGYVSRGPSRTAVRLTVRLAARADRTLETLVPDTVSSIEVDTYVLGRGQDHTSVTVTNPATVTAIVDAFNGLRGAVVTSWGPCGSVVGTTYLYGFTFHWPGHTLSADPGQPLCGAGRQLVLDGRPLPEELDPSPRLSADRFLMPRGSFAPAAQLPPG